MNSSFDRKEFVEGYLAEAEDHLRSANADLLAVEAALQNNEPHPKAVRDLFRALHTLKGLSAMIGVEPVVDIAHEMETVLRLADRGSGRLSLLAVELLLRGLAAIESRVGAFGAGKAVQQAPADILSALGALHPTAEDGSKVNPARIDLPPELLAKLSSSEQLQLTQGAKGSRRALRINYVPSPGRTLEGVSITKVRERLGLIAEIVKVLPLAMPKDDASGAAMMFALLVLSDASDDVLAEAAFAEVDNIQTIGVEQPLPLDNARWPAELDEVAEGEGTLRTGSIRVDVARLDDALEKLSELVVTRHRLSRVVNDLRQRGVDVRELAVIVDENARQLRDLRGCITRARMVPVQELLERVPLIVRGMTRSTGKVVELQIQAGSAELDKAVGERVFPAIVHLIRNAIDHAIETPLERKALGKPEQGTITVTCFQHSNTELELRVSDDGRGIRPEAVARKAGRPVPCGSQELLELITLPGLSTLEQATNNSGRGMGMDIVQRIAVGTLGGSLTLDTQADVGTTFTLRIPLSISIVDSFSFGCGGQTFVVPVSMVEEIIDLGMVSSASPPTPSGNTPVKLIERRGQTMPLVPLARLFALDAKDTSASHALLIRRAGEPFAFAVDRMFGQHEVVVRPLEDPLVKVTGVSGATDLGDGKPTLVLDLAGLAGDYQRFAQGANA